MKSAPIVASLGSRLQADITLVRLRLAGISRKLISAAFPRRLTPNAIACWFNTIVVKRPILQTETDLIFATGPLSTCLIGAENGAALIARLEKAGFTHVVATAMRERLEQGEILICVCPDNEAEASLARQVFERVEADIIGSRRIAARREMKRQPAMILAAA